MRQNRKDSCGLRAMTGPVRDSWRLNGAVGILAVRESKEGFFDCVPRPPKGGGKKKNAGLRSE